MSLFTYAQLQTQLVHVLLPVPAGRGGAPARRLLLHRPPLARLVTGLRRHVGRRPGQGVDRRPRAHRSPPSATTAPCTTPRCRCPSWPTSRRRPCSPTPKPTLYLHGRDDGCMLLVVHRVPARLPGRGLGDGDRRRHRPLPPRGATRRRQPPSSSGVPDRLTRCWHSPSTSRAGGRDPAAGPLGEPLGHQRARHPLRPAPGRRASRRRRPARLGAHRRAAARRAAAPGPGGPSRRRRSGVAPSGSAATGPERSRPCAPPGALAAQRAHARSRARRRAHRGTEVEHRLVELPRQPGGHEPVARAPCAWRSVSGGTGHARGPGRARRWCRPRPRRPRRRTCAPPAPCTARRRAASAEPRPRAAPRRRGRPRRPPRPGAGSAPAGCSPAPTRGAPRPPVPPRRRPPASGKAARKRS